MIGGARIHSGYCQQHTCQIPRDENTPFCINPRSPENRYCIFHGKCTGARGCSAQARRSEHQPFPYICYDHRCVVPVCLLPRLRFDFCEQHMCRFLMCELGSMNQGSYCRRHTCTEAGCKEPVVDAHAENRWCTSHSPRSGSAAAAQVEAHGAESDSPGLVRRVQERLGTEEEEAQPPREQGAKAFRHEETTSEADARPAEEFEARLAEEVEARIGAADDARRDHKAREAQGAEHEQLQREELIASEAAERERARLAQEDADARRMAATDQRFLDDLRRERLARRHIEEERRREEEEFRRLRSQGRFADIPTPSRTTKSDDMW